MADHLDIDSALDTVFRGYGSTDAQVSDAIAVLAKDFVVNAGAIIHRETGLPIDDPKVKTYYVEHKPHLMPPVFERSLADRAFLDGSLQARAELLKNIGELEATRLAQSYGLRGLGDTRKGTAPTNDAGKKNDAGKTNPWSDHVSNVDARGRYTAAALSRQSSLAKSLPLDRVAALATAAGSFIGSTGNPRAVAAAAAARRRA